MNACMQEQQIELNQIILFFSYFSHSKVLFKDCVVLMEV